MTVNILLADDHNILRQGLRALLENEKDFYVVGEAEDGLEALQLAERETPDVMVVDLMMPGLNGLEVTRQIHQTHPDTSIIILSMHAKEAYVLEALKNGASGYVLKDARVNDLVQAVREVTSGRRYLSPPLTERAIEAYMRKLQTDELDIYETLTSREREMLQLAAEGKTNREIAELLSISPRTVEVHRASMMRKLNLKSQVDLVRYALKRGILPMED